MRAIWTASFLLLATACGSADSEDPAPTTNELAGDRGVDEPKDAGPTLHDCDHRKVTCQTFAPVVCPDGEVPTVVDSCYGECVPKAQCAPGDEP